MMTLRDVELEMCAEIARQVTVLLSGSEVAQSAPAGGSSGAQGNDEHPTNRDPRPACGTCFNTGRPGGSRAASRGEAPPAPCPDCGSYGRGRGVQPELAAEPEPEPEPELAAEPELSLMLEANESLRAVVLELAAERDALAMSAKAERTASKALLRAVANAMKMFFNLIPSSDGQVALYPIRGEHLSNFRKCQNLAEELRAQQQENP